MEFHFFAWFGTVSLILLSWQDFKNNRIIDDRRNFFMFGVAAVIPMLLGLSFWFVLIHLIIIFVLRHYVIKYGIKFGFLGGGDISALFWAIMGLGWFGFFVLGVYFIYLFGLTAVYYGVKKIMKIENATPFMIVLLCAFVLTCASFGLY